ncbi:MAG: 6-phosphofructokinase [Ignavibacteriales bacterium]|nr:6-phosphofructokinase [Ignavibacteriales bacterium]
MPRLGQSFDGGSQGWEAYGVRNGYRGLAGLIERLTTRDVGGILQRAAPCWEALDALNSDPSMRKEAIRNMNQLGIDALVVIGGNGSQTSNQELHKMGFPVVSASTIDNDRCCIDSVCSRLFNLSNT